MQPVPASALEVIQAAFLLGIFVKLLDHPAGVGQRDKSFQRGAWGQRAKPVLRLHRFWFPCGFLLGGVVRWQRLVSGRLLTCGCRYGALGEQPTLGAVLSLSMVDNSVFSPNRLTILIDPAYSSFILI